MEGSALLPGASASVVIIADALGVVLATANAAAAAVGLAWRLGFRLGLALGLSLGSGIGIGVTATTSLLEHRQLGIPVPDGRSAQCPR